jgi:hypothetical protein
MPAADPVLSRCGGDGQMRCDDLEDGHPMLRHATDCHACPDSPVAYQVSPMSWTQTLPRQPTTISCGVWLVARPHVVDRLATDRTGWGVRHLSPCQVTLASSLRLGDSGSPVT